MDRAGYLRWRETLKQFHAKRLGEIMSQAGYGPVDQEKAKTLLTRRALSGDPEGQLLEDALCLDFLDTQLADFKLKTPDEKMRGIVKKTWAKMGPRGREEALKIPLPSPLKAWLLEVLA